MGEHKKKFCVYTAVFGKPDHVFPTGINDPDVDKIIFTDIDDLNCADYERRLVGPTFSNSTRDNRFWKIRAKGILENYEYSLYIDSNLKLTKSPADILTYLLPDTEIILFPHPYRNTVFEEAQEICNLDRFKKKGKDFISTIKTQMLIYRTSELGDKKLGRLLSGGFLFRKHTEKIIEFSKEWVDEVMRFSERDQLSLPYALQWCDVQPTLINQNIYSNDFFKIYAHAD